MGPWRGLAAVGVAVALLVNVLALGLAVAARAGLVRTPEDRWVTALAALPMRNTDDNDALGLYPGPMRLLPLDDLLVAGLEIEYAEWTSVSFLNGDGYRVKFGLPGDPEDPASTSANLQGFRLPPSTEIPPPPWRAPPFSDLAPPQNSPTWGYFIWHRGLTVNGWPAAVLHVAPPDLPRESFPDYHEWQVWWMDLEAGHAYLLWFRGAAADRIGPTPATPNDRRHAEALARAAERAVQVRGPTLPNREPHYMVPWFPLDDPCPRDLEPGWCQP